MGKITEISAQKKHKSRVNVYVDGEFAVGLEAITVLSAGLKTGNAADKATLERLQLESEGETAFRRAVEYLARRMRTEKELRDYLTGKDYAESVVDNTIEKLRAYGYVDDKEFTAAYVGNYADRRGKKRLRQDLARLGADAETISAALETVGDQRDAAVRAAEKYLRTRAFDAHKLTAHLASKGFEWDDVTAAVRACGGKEEE